jgi:hypothetical protein
MSRKSFDLSDSVMNNAASTVVNNLMFVTCFIWRSRNNQHYALICTTPLFYILAPTCFDSSLPSSGNFLDPSELLEIQIEWVIYHIMCGYVACVPECRGSVCCASQLSAYMHPAGKHNRPRKHTYDYTTNLICISGNSEGSKKLPDDGRLLPSRVGASM